MKLAIFCYKLIDEFVENPSIIKNLKPLSKSFKSMKVGRPHKNVFTVEFTPALKTDSDSIGMISSVFKGFYDSIVVVEGYNKLFGDTNTVLNKSFIKAYNFYQVFEEEPNKHIKESAKNSLKSKKKN